MTSQREDDLTYFGCLHWQEGMPLLGIRRRDRRQHQYVIGRSGTGKTTLLFTQLLHDIKVGEGCTLIDPHGDLAEKILDYVPARRINDVVYFNPADGEFPIALNLLERVSTHGPASPVERTLVCSGLLSVFRRIWADSWGPRMEHILRNALLALLEVPGTTLLAVPRLLTDERYRAGVVRQVSDPVVATFWTEEFPQYGRSFRAEALSPILNKVGAFLSNHLIRNIISQPRSTLSVTDVVDDGRILIMNLSKGRIGEDGAALLGAMMIVRLQLAVMERARIPEENRRDHWLYIDEFQSFAGDSFATILSEARKFRLGLVCANQYLGQLPLSLRDAIFGNVGTLISFRVGPQDAEQLEPEFWPQFHREQLVNFPNHRGTIKMSLGGVPQPAAGMSTILPDDATLRDGHRDKIIRESRHRYGRGRRHVEERVLRWIGGSAGTWPIAEAHS